MFPVIFLRVFPGLIFSSFWYMMSLYSSFPSGSNSKESAFNAGDPGAIPGLGRSPGEENGYPLQYSCLENSKDRGFWRDTVHGVVKSQGGRVGHD